MDWLRRIWSASPPKPSVSLFEVPAITSTVDRKRLAYRIRTALFIILPVELRSIVIDYAADLPYRWTSSSDWRSEGLTIVDNRATCDCPYDVWRRPVASDWLVVGGLRRWRILATADSLSGKSAAVAVGVSAATMPPVSKTDPMMKHPLDFVILACLDSAASVDVWIHAGAADNYRSGIQSVGRQQMFLVDVDLAGKTVDISFLDDDSAVRTIRLRLPDAADWRPIVALTGAASAVILDWPDD